MPIAPLEASTVRALGSAQVLTDSTSLVKELLDNALDAEASNISVEISANALEKIQVTDNGTGIQKADRELVCKRYCTSKITDFHDLRTIGGSSLGFRGEALASAVELSQSVIITTRTKDEPVGTALTFDREGKLLSQQQTSHPTGSTIVVTDFLASLPIRKQVALKTASKAPASIKALVQTYAIARPTTRFSLKVLKAKDTKSNWSYSPRPDATALNAILQIAGTQISQQCNVHTWSTDTEPPFRFQAVLPKASSDSASSHGKQYIIVDGRPLSVARTGAKGLAKIVKSYVRAAAGGETENGSHSEPFFSMSIECPPGSYDANVEPAKDDVLFEDIETVKEHLEAFLSNIYGPLNRNQENLEESMAVPLPERNPVTIQPAFDILMNSSYRSTPATQTKSKNSQSQRDLPAQPTVNMLAGNPIQIRPRRVEDEADESIFDRAQRSFQTREESTDDGGIFLEPESSWDVPRFSNDQPRQSFANSLQTPVRSTRQSKSTLGQFGSSQQTLHGYLPTPQSEHRSSRMIHETEMNYDIGQLRGDFHSARTVLEGLPLDKMPEMACRRPKASRQTRDQSFQDDVSAESDDIEEDEDAVTSSRSKLPQPRGKQSLTYNPVNGLSAAGVPDQGQRSNRSPHRNRYLAAKAALNAPATNRIEDPRNEPESGCKDLPLEATPSGQETLDLICTVNLDLSQLEQVAIQDMSRVEPDSTLADFLKDEKLCEWWKRSLVRMYQKRTSNETLLVEILTVDVAQGLFLEA